LTNASGLTDVGAPAGGVGTAWTMADCENLYFGVGLQYRTAPSVAFVSNDTTYKRVRAIRTATGYQTEAIGPDIGSYRVFDLPWRVQNDIPNATAFCGDLKKYRMYRRVGLAAEMTTEGRTLRLNNLALLTIRARYGGRIMDANAIAKGTQYQA
jgi:HK97 family phage major capsid protein